MDIILFLLIITIPAVAQASITSSYNKYHQVKNHNGLTGQEVARKILDINGLNNVYVVETNGFLSDHYDPKRKVVRLSKEVFNGETISAISVAAHECGHAIQDKEGYIMMKIRSLIFPVVNIGTTLSYIIILIGVIAQLMDVIYLGIALTGLGLIFQLVTLPVEFNASKRALKIIGNEGMVTDTEHTGAKKVLTAAAMTYVAGVLASALQILRLILIFTDNRR